MKNQWRMRCYYCEQYKNGTCPYKKREVVPKKCRKFVHLSMYVPREFSGFEMENQWKMHCYSCKKYINGTCPYKNRKQVPLDCSSFESGVYIERGFTRFEKVMIVIVILIAIIGGIAVIGSVLLEPLI
jgi:hypothetical protein